MRFVLGLLAALWCVSAQAQYLPLYSSPDLSVSSSATADFVPLDFSGSAVIHADWFAIKNDCTDTLYFSPNNKDRTATDYPLRLEPGESFSAPFRIYSLGVSNDNSSDCTFTFVPARRFGP